MRSLTAVGLITLVACLTACGSNAVASSTSGQNAQHRDGAIAGTFRIVGGPYPGINRLENGTIEIRSKSATGPVVAKVKTTKGHYTAEVPPGPYVVVGYTPQITGDTAGCTSDRAVKVVAGKTTRAEVQCDVP